MINKSFTGNPKLNKRQRDVLILKAETNDSIAQSRELSIAPNMGTDPIVRRRRRVATRLFRFVAGFTTSDEVSAKRNEIIDAYVSGSLTALEAFESFRWLGMTESLAGAALTFATEKRNAELRDWSDAKRGVDRLTERGEQLQAAE